jgi:hypothetical protein
MLSRWQRSNQSWAMVRVARTLLQRCERLARPPDGQHFVLQRRVLDALRHVRSQVSLADGLARRQLPVAEHHVRPAALHPGAMDWGQYSEKPRGFTECVIAMNEKKVWLIQGEAPVSSPVAYVPTSLLLRRQVTRTTAAPHSCWGYKLDSLRQRLFDQPHMDRRAARKTNHATTAPTRSASACHANTGFRKTRPPSHSLKLRERC